MHALLKRWQSFCCCCRRRRGWDCCLDLECGCWPSAPLRQRELLNREEERYTFVFLRKIRNKNLVSWGIGEESPMEQCCRGAMERSCHFYQERILIKSIYFPPKLDEWWCVVGALEGERLASYPISWRWILGSRKRNIPN